MQCPIRSLVLEGLPLHLTCPGVHPFHRHAMANSLDDVLQAISQGSCRLGEYLVCNQCVTRVDLKNDDVSACRGSFDDVSRGNGIADRPDAYLFWGSWKSTNTT